jgi:hypothetical protein
MTPQERVKISIPKLYRRQALDMLMFGFVGGMKAALPSLTINECLQMFQKEHSFSEDEYPLRSAWQTYNRMMEEYHDTRRSNNSTKCSMK